ncbi:serine acetyltransferase [Pantoea sp. FN060301]|uniref:serine acetyltransferase n=1 Tax=Pantoea sp. FN060301 TaxID=3420380 RepID=UPI003D186EF4
MDSPLLLTENAHCSYAHFKECLRLEVIHREGKKKFSWFKILHRVLFSYKKRYYFWWRLANYWHTLPSARYRKWARRINHNLLQKYGADISVAAYIAPGMKINHYVGIVIRAECIIGRNINLRQNTTIGRRDSVNILGKTIIGDNVEIGAHSCIIGDVRIGDNVIIGAMSFINKDIPENSVVYCDKVTTIRERQQKTTG